MSCKWMPFSTEPVVFHAVQPWSVTWGWDLSWLTLCGTEQTDLVEEDSDGDLRCLLCRRAEERYGMS